MIQAAQGPDPLLDLANLSLSDVRSSFGYFHGHLSGDVLRDDPDTGLCPECKAYFALDSGILMLPGAIVMGIMSPITGRLFDRFGPRILALDRTIHHNGIRLICCHS